MKTAWLVGTVFIMLSCGSFLRGSTNQGGSKTGSTIRTSSQAPGCPRQEAITALIEDLEQCEAQIGTMPNTVVQVKHVPIEKIVTKVEKRYCANAGPDIKPVPTTKCMSGQLCLDEEGQRVLAKNMAAYEAWIQRIKDCEAK